MIYLDTSVLVAYYVPEKLSAQVQQRLLEARAVIISELVQTEFVSALSLRYRIGDLLLADVQNVIQLFQQHMSDGLYRPLHLNSAVYRLAQTYIARFDLPLKTLDALHLAAAAREQLTLVTADRQLAGNAKIIQIDVELLSV